MSLLDIPTLMAIYTITNFVCMVVMALLWKQNRRRFAGLGFWLADFVMQFVGIALISLRGHLPDLVSMTLGNTMIIGGTLLLLIGLEHYTGRHGRRTHHYILLAIFVCAHAFFVVFPDTRVRVILISVTLFAFCAQCAWLALVRIGPDRRTNTRGVGHVFVAFCVVTAARIVVDLVVPLEGDSFRASDYDSPFLVTYQALFIVLTFSLFLMVNRRQFSEQEEDISARRKAERALTERVKELACVFHLSNLIRTPGISLDGILKGTVHLVASAIQYPEVAGARLVVEGRSYATDNYRDTPRKLSRLIKKGGREIGTLEVCYSEALPKMESGLFLEEERKLLDEVAERLVQVIEGHRTEKALELSEEKFAKAFRSSPDAILISRLSDGRLIDVNDGFCRMTGYARDVALSGSSSGLGLWANPQEWEKATVILRERLHVRDLEIAVRAKSGKVLTCSYSGEIIYLNNAPHVLSVVRDISRRKLGEWTLRLRLRLWEYAAAHPLEELMQKALDEISELTESQIGFYHFVDEDQNTISLRAWSTRTLQEFCKAEGRDMHYPIQEAGVWVDCIRQRKPVIHNDYATLLHRRGLPEGHAELVRELVVPTMRGGKIVSVLGVGNKLSDYDEQDVELVSYSADVIWTIVEQKRAQEQIRQLNGKLERLAMTDELTRLANRRYFFLQGSHEISRSRRYGSPLSLIMVDVDGLKHVNDTFGHEAGDLLLQRISRHLRENVREIDVLARLGGDEFGILLPNTGAADAAKSAERLRQIIDTGKCPFQGQELGLTVSLGVAPYRKEMPDLDSLLREADVALYEAKREGRNRVSLSSGDTPEATGAGAA